MAACVANQCATSPVSGCVDAAVPDDLSVAPNDLAEPADQTVSLSPSGGGGCALVAGAAPADDAAARGLALAGVALALAFSFRRRYA